MSGYGFRLYTVKLVNGAKKSKAVDFGKCGARSDQHAGVWIRRLLSKLEGYGPLTGPPILSFAVDESYEDLAEISSYVRKPKRGEYRTNFVSHESHPVHKIKFKIEYGRTGKVSVGILDDETIPLDQIPTGDTYRAILYMPAEGTVGVLALEAVPSAPNPARMLNNWLARAALDVAEEDRLLISKLPEKEQASAKPQPFKLNFNQYPNVDRIEKAVTSNTTAKVVLKRDSIDGSGKPVDESMIFSSTLRADKRRNAAAKLAANMVKKALGKLEDDADAVTVEDLEELIDGSLEGIEWTEGYIQIEDEGLKKIGLDHIDKFFIYPVGSTVPPGDTKFEHEVAAEVVSLLSVLGVELDLS